MARPTRWSLHSPSLKQSRTSRPVSERTLKTRVADYASSKGHVQSDNGKEPGVSNKAELHGRCEGTDDRLDCNTRARESRRVLILQFFF